METYNCSKIYLLFSLSLILQWALHHVKHKLYIRVTKPGISQEVLSISEVILYPGKNTKNGNNGERLTLVILRYLINSEIVKVS